MLICYSKAHASLSKNKFYSSASASACSQIVFNFPSIIGSYSHKIVHIKKEYNDYDMCP